MNRNSMGHLELEAKLRHQHACSSCVRLHPEAEILQSAPQARRHTNDRHRLFRWDCTSKLCVEDRLHDYLDTDTSSTSSRTRQTPGQVDADVEFRHRRHTLAIGPRSRSIDTTKPILKPSSAQRQLDAKATQLQTAGNQTHASAQDDMKRPEQHEPRASDLCDCTRVATRMDTRNSVEKPTSTHKGTVSRSLSCDFTGTEPVMTVSDELKEMKHPTKDSGRAKYTNDLPPVPIKRGRRASVDAPCNRAVLPVSSNHSGAIDTELALVQPRYDFSVKNIMKQSRQPTIFDSVSNTDRNSFFTSKKHDAQAIDCHRSTLDRRLGDRRHTMTDALTKNLRISQHENQEDLMHEVGGREHDRLKHKKKVELVDFHLSMYKLITHKSTVGKKSTSSVARYASRGKKDEEITAKPVVAAREVGGSNRSKNELCDLAYLDAFKTYTL